MPPALEVHVVVPAHKRRGQLFQVVVTDDTIWAVGGRTSTVTVIASSNGHRFHGRSTPPKGIRELCVVDGGIVVVGEWGMIARSRDRGATWQVIDTDFDSCLFSIRHDHDGTVWIAGDDGVVGRLVGDTFTRIDTGVNLGWSSITRAAGTLWLLGYGGGLYRFDGQRATRVLESKRLSELIELADGVLLVAGDQGQLYRSIDGGVSFEPIDLHTVEPIEALATTAEGAVVAVGGGGTILVSRDGGQTFEAAAHELGNRVTLWSLTRIGDALFVGGDNGLLLRLGPDLAARWTDRPDVFAVARPLDEVFAAGPDGFLEERLRAYVLAVDPRAAASGDTLHAQAADASTADEPDGEAPDADEAADGEPAADAPGDAVGADAWQQGARALASNLWTGTTADYAAIWGAPPPPDLVAFETATAGADLYSTFKELRLDVSLMSNLDPEQNLFEMLVVNDQLNYLGTGLPEAFGGVTCIGQLGNGDTYHYEVYVLHPDHPRSVVFWDHEEHQFSYVFTNSLSALVYLCALARAADNDLVSEDVAAAGFRSLRGRVAPSWHFSIEERDPGFTPYQHPGEAELVRYACARAHWMFAMFRQDGITEIGDIANLFSARLNDVLTPEQLERRLEFAARLVPTALYAMWRAFFFDEPELERFLAIGRAHPARLARDAARLIDELRAGRNQLGKIKDVRRWLERFRALDLDPRRAEERAREATRKQQQDTARVAEVLASFEQATAAGPASVEQLAWAQLDASRARPQLLRRILEDPMRADARAAIEYLAAGGFSYDNSIFRDEEYAACRHVADHADAVVQALLVGEALWPAPADDKADEGDGDEGDDDGSSEAPPHLGSHHAWEILTRLARTGRLDPRALPPLRAALDLERIEDHAEWGIRRIAAVLGWARDRAAVPALRAVLDKMPAEGGFDAALKYDDVIGDLALALRRIGDRAGALPLVRFASSTAERMRDARTHGALAVGVLAPELGGDPVLRGMLALASDNEDGHRAIAAFGLVARAQPPREHGRWAAELSATKAGAAVGDAKANIELRLTVAVALHLLGQPPADPSCSVATLMLRAFTEPGWKEAYTVRRRRWALELYRLVPGVEPDVIVAALDLGDETFADEVIAVLGESVRARLPRTLSYFVADKAGDAQLIELLRDDALGARHLAALILGRRTAEAARPALEQVAEAIAIRAPHEPGRDLSGADDRLLRETVRGLNRLPPAPTTIAVFARLLVHPNRNVKDPVLRDPPRDPALQAGMRQVAAEAWGWQESTARAWLAALGQ